MNNDSDNHSIKDQVLKAIEAGKVQMKPKWHFVLYSCLLFVGTILVTLTLVYVASFAIFVLHQTGVWFVPSLGFRGIGVFLISLPWLLVLIGILFIILLEVLVQRYAFGYRKPFLYTALGIIIFVLLGGLVVAQTPFHRGLFEQARDNHLPFAGGFYRQFGMQRPPGNVEVGMVTEKTATGYKIKNPRGEMFEVVATPETQFPQGSEIAIKDIIVVLGEHNGSTITAAAIRKVEENEFPPHDFRPHGPGGINPL